MTNPAFTRIITIDGPSGSGKGTVAVRIADQLGWNYLDSGALYRLTAISSLSRWISLEDEDLVARVAAELDIRFSGEMVWLDGQDVTSEIRTEQAGNGASKVAKLPKVREALLHFQYEFAQEPGLVTDGRDMGTAVFPHAMLKVFLTASAEARANRRYNQLLRKGIEADYETILRDLEERDARDTTRAVNPLRPTEDAFILDTTNLGIDESVSAILAQFNSLKKETGQI